MAVFQLSKKLGLLLKLGDVFANLNYPALGNIYRDSINETVQKEIAIGQPNLCHVK